GEEARAEGVRRRSGARGQNRRAAQGTGRADDAACDVPGAAARSSGHGGQLRAASRPMLTVGLDIGSTTVKANALADGQVRWQHYARHNTKQAETVLEFLVRMQAECGLQASRDRVFVTGSGAGTIAPHLGARFVQEVVAVSAAVEKLHPEVSFVSEI